MLACCREFYEKLKRKNKVRFIGIKYSFGKPVFLFNFKNVNSIFLFLFWFRFCLKTKTNEITNLYYYSTSKKPCCQ